MAGLQHQKHPSHTGLRTTPKRYLFEVWRFVGVEGAELLEIQGKGVFNSQSPAAWISLGRLGARVKKRMQANNYNPLYLRVDSKE